MFEPRMCKPGGVSLFDMELGEVMVVHDREELLAAKLKHIFVPFKLEHAAPQGLGVCLG